MSELDKTMTQQTTGQKIAHEAQHWHGCRDWEQWLSAAIDKALEPQKVDLEKCADAIYAVALQSAIFSQRKVNNVWEVSKMLTKAALDSLIEQGVRIKF
jgi:hypothetical protein